MKVETTDIYFSAYLMVKGVTLHSMSVGNGGQRPKVFFTFSGNGELSRLNREFQQGKALVNLIDLKLLGDRCQAQTPPVSRKVFFLLFCFENIFFSQR